MLRGGPRDRCWLCHCIFCPCPFLSQAGQCSVPSVPASCSVSWSGDEQYLPDPASALIHRLYKYYPGPLISRLVCLLSLTLSPCVQSKLCLSSLPDRCSSRGAGSSSHTGRWWLRLAAIAGSPCVYSTVQRTLLLLAFGRECAGCRVWPRTQRRGAGRQAGSQVPVLIPAGLRLPRTPVLPERSLLASKSCSISRQRSHYSQGRFSRQKTFPASGRLHPFHANV